MAEALIPGDTFQSAAVLRCAQKPAGDMLHEAVDPARKMKRRNESFCVARLRSWDGLADGEKPKAPFPYKKLEKSFKMNTLSCPAGLYAHASIPVEKLNRVAKVEGTASSSSSQLSREIAKLQRAESDEDVAVCSGHDRQAERVKEVLVDSASTFQFRKCQNCQQLFVNTDGDFIPQVSTELQLNSLFCSGECYITHISKVGTK